MYVQTNVTMIHPPYLLVALRFLESTLKLIVGTRSGIELKVSPLNNPCICLVMLDFVYSVNEDGIASDFIT